MAQVPQDDHETLTLTLTLTPACGYVTQMWAIFIGGFTAIVCYFGPRLGRMCGNRDDVLDSFAYHGIGGIIGGILTGLFASKTHGDSPTDGAFYGNPKQLYIQV